jgi:hypothetical protein
VNKKSVGGWNKKNKLKKRKKKQASLSEPYKPGLNSQACKS